MTMTLPTGDVISIGSAVSVCVRRWRGRQMYWYAGMVLDFDGDRALVELCQYKGEQALLGPRNIRIREAAPNA